MPYWASAWAFAAVFTAAPALAALLAAAPQDKVALPSGGSVSYSSAGSQTRLEIGAKGGRKYEVRVERDATVAPDTSPDEIQVVAEIAGKTLILTDSYPSIPLGMQYCQAGEERFLRVITFAGARASETLHLKLASCRDDVELADPGFEWDREADTLRIHWLAGPEKKGASEERTIHIESSGKPD
ncbi:MAG TPA: hypothetical protein VHU83_01085 [Bryobacteraceae bacterium]|jgi:hypothetical protein|nr:hypothetical protein [Bryobacteraceae bacterium]